jgi:hypothetical protein
MSGTPKMAIPCYGLFRPKGFDWIEVCSFSRGVITKADSNQSGEKNRKKHRSQAHNGIPAGQPRD